MGILISFGSSGGEWVTRFPFYESGYASPSWRRCYMMAAGAFEVPLVAFRVVIFWASRIAGPGAELGIFTIPNETLFVSLSPPRVLVSGTG